MFRLPAVLSLVIAGLCLMIQNPITAGGDWTKKIGGPYSPTAQELKMLPPACIAEFGRDPEEVKKWKKILGDSFMHMHHHCAALNFLNRIHRGIGDKNTLLGEALGNFKYMRRIPEDHILRPEVEYNIGHVLYQMNRISEATAPIRKAIRLKPDYEQAYLLLSFCYLRMGDGAQAAEVLRIGLTRVPNSRVLQNALQEINPTKKESGGDGH